MGLKLSQNKVVLYISHIQYWNLLRMGWYLEATSGGVKEIFFFWFLPSYNLLLGETREDSRSRVR